MAENAGDWQSIAEIGRVAEAFIHDRVKDSDRRVKPSAGHLDPRLKLQRCDAALEAFLRDDTSIRRRTVVGVRCTGTSPWKIYVPVNVSVTESVLVIKRSLPRGHKLTESDITVEQRDVSRLNGGYIVERSAAVGQRLKQQVMGGRVITPALLFADAVVKRGQSVTLIVQNGRMNITMAGKALMDGAVNQRIRVENLASKRVVEGLVRSPEYVEVLVQ